MHEGWRLSKNAICMIAIDWRRFQAGGKGMRRLLSVVAGLLASVMLVACGGEGDKGDSDMFSKDLFDSTDVNASKDLAVSKEDAGTGDLDGKQTGEATLSFDSFDGGGPEFSVIVYDEDIVACRQEVRYKRSDHDEMTGGGKTVVITFAGMNPGETKVLIEERSPIADNRDWRYKAVVDAELNVCLEEISVRDVGEASEDMRLYVNGEEVPVIWEENESVEELKSMLPITVQMSRYGGFEQVGPIGSSIFSDDERITTEAGDIVLYSGNQIVIFYGSNTWAYTRLGHVDLLEEEMAELLGNGDVEIVLE